MRCSLYIHIPFCRKKCRYCDFVSFAGKEDLIDAYIDAVSEEWKLYEQNGSYEFTTVYIGGGTPSLLSTEQWERFSKTLLCKLPIVTSAEWTVECNPDSWSAEKARFLASIGVNRLVLGVQSFDDRALRVAGRLHSAIQAERILNDPSMDCFQSIGVDLIYGLPGESISSFEKNFVILLNKPIIKHISVYELTIANNTPFARHRRLLPLPEEETLTAVSDIVGAATKNFGFFRYEISNYSRKGFRCTHNCNYWDHGPYLGLGCAAHSYIHPRRFRNIGNIEQYCYMVNKGIFPIEDEEHIDAETLAREMVFLGLRRIEGINETVFHEKTSIDFRTWAEKKQLGRFIDEGLIEYHPPWWNATERGMLFVDYIARELF